MDTLTAPKIRSFHAEKRGLFALTTCLWPVEARHEPVPEEWHQIPCLFIGREVFTYQNELKQLHAFMDHHGFIDKENMLRVHIARQSLAAAVIVAAEAQGVRNRQKQDAVIMSVLRHYLAQVRRSETRFPPAAGESPSLSPHPPSLRTQTDKAPSR